MTGRILCRIGLHRWILWRSDAWRSVYKCWREGCLAEKIRFDGRTYRPR